MCVCVCVCVCVCGCVVECAERWLVSGCTTRGRKHAGMWGGSNSRGHAQGAGMARAGAASQRQRAGSETDLFSKVELDHKGYTTLSLHTNLKHELDHKGHTTLTSHHSDSTPCAHSSLHPAAPCSLHPRGKRVAVLCSEAQDVGSCAVLAVTVNVASHDACIPIMHGA